jgi:hypothetical protein
MCIRVLVKDATKAKQEFGPYVEAVQGDVMTETSLQQAMRSTRVVVMAGACGHAVREAQKFGIEHIVLVSSAGTVPLFLGTPPLFLSTVPLLYVQLLVSRYTSFVLGTVLVS